MDALTKKLTDAFREIGYSEYKQIKTADIPFSHDVYANAIPAVNSEKIMHARRRKAAKMNDGIISLRTKMHSSSVLPYHFAPKQTWKVMKPS